MTDIGWFEFVTADKSATTHVAYVYEDGSVYLPEGPSVVDETDFRLAAATERFWKLERSMASVNGALLIAAERQRQIDTEGWTPEHDDEHEDGALASAAAAYIFPDGHDHFWPWDETWWKPSDDPIRSLVKAGALIAAEIDRLQRAATFEVPT